MNPLENNVKAVLKQASMTPTTKGAENSRIPPRPADIQRKLASEYRIEGSFQLRPMMNVSSNQCLYEESQGGQFQLRLPLQGQRPENPMIFKYLHVRDLTYDTEMYMVMSTSHIKGQMILSTTVKIFSKVANMWRMWNHPPSKRLPDA